MRRALQIVLALAAFGSVFSGVLFGMFVAIAVVAAVGLVRGRSPSDGARAMVPQVRSAGA